MLARKRQTRNRGRGILHQLRIQLWISGRFRRHTPEPSNPPELPRDILLQQPLPLQLDIDQIIAHMHQHDHLILTTGLQRQLGNHGPDIDDVVLGILLAGVGPDEDDGARLGLDGMNGLGIETVGIARGAFLLQFSPVDIRPVDLRWRHPIVDFFVLAQSVRPIPGVPVKRDLPIPTDSFMRSKERIGES